MGETNQIERANEAATGPQTGGAPAGETVQTPNVVVDDLAIEDVSIDGMCGVY